MNDDPTKKEHYVPQSYLRGFSPQYKLAKRKQIKNSKCMIYCYDLKKKKQSHQIPIKSICYEKNLYEIMNELGEIIHRNHLEKIFGVFEIKFSEFRTLLERKAFREDSFCSDCFLTQEEMAFWVTFMAIQTLRSPRILKEAALTLKSLMGESISDIQAHNISRLYCLPFFREINQETPEAFLFNMLFEPMMDMSFVVCVDKKGRIITSDKTMYVYATEFPTKEYEKVIYPITSELCLILLGGEEKKEYKRDNFLVPMNASTRKMIVQAISDSAFEKIFANHALDEQEMRWVEEVMRAKE